MASFVLASPLAFGGERDYFFYDLGNLGCTGSSANDAYDITDTGIIAGYGIEPGCPLEAHAILWDNGRMTDLNGTYSGVLSGAVGISETQVIVALALPRRCTPPVLIDVLLTNVLLTMRGSDGTEELFELVAMSIAPLLLAELLAKTQLMNNGELELRKAPPVLDVASLLFEIMQLLIVPLLNQKCKPAPVPPL